MGVWAVKRNRFPLEVGWIHGCLDAPCDQEFPNEPLCAIPVEGFGGVSDAG